MGVYMKELIESIEDFSDKIEDGTIKVCFLHENSKVSKQGWAGFVKPEELYAPENNDNNLDDIKKRFNIRNDIKYDTFLLFCEISRFPLIPALS